MARVFKDRIITSIDVGTTKICVLIAQQLEGEAFEIIGVGKAPSDGLRKGVVVDVSKTVYSIKVAVKEAELMAGVSVESAYIGISGAHIVSVNSHGVVPIKRGQICADDVERALAAAQAMPIEKDHQILHVLPQYFVIDARDKVSDPIGMHGIRLEVQAHIIMGAVASVQNLVHCCEMAGVQVRDIILEQLASADAVLSKDERELGVAVLDIGGGTSDLAIYQHGSIRHTMVLPVAGNHFTNDVAVGLRTTLQEAERIKKEYGCALFTFDTEERDAIAHDRDNQDHHVDIDNNKAQAQFQDKLIEIEMVQGAERQIVRVSDLIRILGPRTQELLRLVHEEIVKRKLSMFMPTGLVLTGGGSLLRGIEECAKSLFNAPVRIGHPRITFQTPNSLQSPIYATGYGLLVHALKKQAWLNKDGGNSAYKKVFDRMKSWVADFF